MLQDERQHQHQHQQSEEQLEKLIDQSTALSRFDAAVPSSEINYSPTTSILFTDNGFAVNFDPIHLKYSDRGTLTPIFLQFQFRICSQFRQKPQLPPADATPHPANEDIDQPPSLDIAFLPPAHKLVYNTYPALRPSYLLLTASSLHHQSSPLTLTDIIAARTALAGLSRESGGENGAKQEGDETGSYMLIFNCGRASGCSRSHKHMQLFPRLSPASFQLFPDRPSDKPENVPYLYDLFHHSASPSLGLFDDPDTPTSIATFYESSLSRFRALLKIEGEDEHIPHNVIMTREWTIVIPRRAARVNGLSANATGMMGMVWVSTMEEVEQWKREGPRRILGELGLKAEETG